MGDIFVGRQPIFDRKLKVYGYELLYRHCITDKALFMNGDQATLQVLVNSFVDIGIDRIAQNRLAFINLTSGHLLDKLPILLPPGQVVLELLENTPVNNDLISALHALSLNGYQIALDDFTYHKKYDTILKFVNIVKLDVMAIERSRLEEAVNSLKNFPVKILAEKVETLDDYEYCNRLGFDYFQGYFLCRPNIIEGRKTNPLRLVVLRLLQKVQSPDVEFSDLEMIIAQDVSLGYRLLKLVNSVYFGLPKEITSIRHAMTILGLNQLREWITLFLLLKFDTKPNELIVLAMVRARMMELIAEATGRKPKDAYFLVGLFSVLDALLDLPMQDALASLSLSNEIVEALCYQKGPLGEVLQIVIAYEREEWGFIASTGLGLQKVGDAYLQSLDWIKKLTMVI